MSMTNIKELQILPNKLPTQEQGPVSELVLKCVQPPSEQSDLKITLYKILTTLKHRNTLTIKPFVILMNITKCTERCNR